jgi:predicted dehydrogenase
MLADKNIELVIVNTPSVTHFEFAMERYLLASI